MRKNTVIFYGVFIFIVCGLILLIVTSCNKEPAHILPNVNETPSESKSDTTETDKLKNIFKTELFKISSATENGEGTIGGEIDEIQVSFEIPCEWKQIFKTTASCAYEYDAKHLGFGIMRLNLSLNKITVSKEEHIKNWSDDAIPSINIGKTTQGYDYMLQNSLSAAYPTYYIFLTDNLILRVEYTDDYGFYNLSNVAIRRIINSIEFLQ